MKESSPESCRLHRHLQISSTQEIRCYISRGVKNSTLLIQESQHRLVLLLRLWLFQGQTARRCVGKQESNAGSAHIAGSSATITRSPRAKGGEQWVPQSATRQMLEQHKGKTFRYSDPAVRSSRRAIADSTHLLQQRGDKKKPKQPNNKTPRRAECMEGNANDLFR